jgi:hypothetical protein
MSTPLAVIEAIRQNHAVEHATIHVLSRDNPTIKVVGRTNLGGFLLWGNVATETVVEAVLEAIRRLRAGEGDLAIHPNCGSNIVAGGMLAGVSVLLATRGRRRSVWDQLPSALLAATTALLVAQPLGLLLQQRVTTTSNIAHNLRLHQVIAGTLGSTSAHRVELVRD